nr:hypothetical protein B0A51_04646 [Rachicladosporium sp. CCFEE 5018]
MESGVDAEDAPSFDKPRHIKYWTRCLKTLLPSVYTSNDSNRMYLAYFILSACDILGVLFTLTTAEEREGYLTWIYHCQHPNGGFRMWPGTDFGESSSAANAKWDPANGPATYFALASLMILRDDLQRVKRRETLEWIHRLQHADGSFGETIVDGKIEGGHDPRLAYCATGVRYILRHSEASSAVADGSTFSDIDIDALVGSIQRAEQSFDGGIADAPFHEPQAGYTFCSLGCMKFVERLRPDTAMSSNTPSLQRAPSRPREVIRWLLNLQTTLTDPDDPPPIDLKSALPDASSPTEIPAGVTAQLQSHNLHQSSDKSSPWTDSSTTLSMSGSSSVYGTKSIPAGFSGRPSKPPDTCYAFWALASLDLLQTSHLAATSQTRTYLLGLTQQAITGGFTKFAHDGWADLYHSYLGLVALSLSSTDVERAADGIVEVDAGMCPDLASIACLFPILMMRLLNIHTLELKDFVSDSDRPPYAIASHRWGAEEVTYRDLTDNKESCKAKVGYRKIQGFCETTQRWNEYVKEPALQCHWLWVDNCCINKGDLSEVNEAINSTFAWYSTAVVCWAYLEDVFGSTIAELQRSVWFKRGWTLHELLAPRTVVFLSHHWVTLGHKCWLHPSVLIGYECCLPMPVLNRVLAVVTGIPEMILYRYDQSTELEAKVKIGWLKDRETTRVEDMSYCLLGIFNVFLPTIYGEREHARERLLEQIDKRRKAKRASSSAKQLTTYLSPACFPCLYAPKGLRVKEQFLLPEPRPAGSMRWLNGTPQRICGGRVTSTPASLLSSRSHSGPVRRDDSNEASSNSMFQRRPILSDAQYKYGSISGESAYSFGPDAGDVPRSLGPVEPLPHASLRQNTQPGLFGRLKKKITRED